MSNDTNLHQRIATERRIVRSVIRALFDAGYRLGVHDGEEQTLKGSASERDVLSAMFTTDEDYLVVERDGKWFGQVRFIYGNGLDVASDWSTSLDDIVWPTIVAATAVRQ